MAQEPKVNILSPRSTRKQPSQKRALPPRHSFLTEAVEVALQKQQQVPKPQLDSSTILLVTNDENALVNFEEKEQLPAAAVLGDKDLVPNVKPNFTVFEKPPRRQKRVGEVAIADVEPIPEEYYLRRHRKHEKEEKKQKNREKEKLQHEMYQQQQFVERIRHTDKSIVMAIATAICQQQQRSVPNVDSLYRQVLHDAEEQLARYEMLGLTLTRKPRNGATPTTTTTTASSQQYPSPLPQPSTTTSSSLAPLSDSSSLSPALSLISQSSSASQSSSLNVSPTISKKSTSPNLKPSRPVRRSVRHTLAFGHKIPVMPETEFQLPYETFGYLMDRRTRAKTTRRK
ncbi:hypothetical protein O0I10_001003 [Lichtheimia ornata]|uniref:Something about silencing protein 4 domain-containing protein n=1 Tax=Lichtheimia ornata TaxID=688661 RepID=A0AAD7Y2Z1_9FUNG|nr:uncharacterized protein O0I10_001003 [Lichtheimia ornata]KAJ8662827.1 hypothetical protein O0I10_001003 [Lichtheimia ornata]